MSKMSMENRGKLTIQIYSSNGQKIKTIADQIKEAGQHSFTWDGTDFSGKAVPGGMYLCKIQTDQDAHILKIILLK